MSETAIFDTAETLSKRIAQVVDGDNLVRIGPPLSIEIGQNLVSLFLFHLQVNKDLRNQERFQAPPFLSPAGQLATRLDALPLDLRFLITVYRKTGNSATESNELETLGKIVQELHTQPTLAGESMKGQVVRLTPEPYPMEEMSRIWSLFGQDTYRTSMVYLASPVYVEAGAVPAGIPVQEHTNKAGLSDSPPNMLRQAQEGE